MESEYQMDCTPLFKNVKKVSRTLNVLDRDFIDKVLLKVADAALENANYIVTENKKDLAMMDESDPRFDRLLLTAGRIESIATDIRNVVKLPSPLGKVLLRTTPGNGLIISKISVPFGVIGVI